jgi:hypothetical protein
MNPGFDPTQPMQMAPTMSLGILFWVGVAIIDVMIVAFLILVVRNGQRRREWEHAERMRSLEMGLPVPPRDAPWAKAAVCIAIGAGVPLVAFVFTYLAFTSKSGVDGEIWLAPALVSGASVIGACILAGTMFHGGSKSGNSSGADSLNGRQPIAGEKPPYDPDALDVVGRRG